MIYLFKYYQSFLKANCRVVSHQPRTIDPKVKILEIVAVFECIRVPEDPYELPDDDRFAPDVMLSSLLKSKRNTKSIDEKKEQNQILTYREYKNNSFSSFELDLIRLDHFLQTSSCNFIKFLNDLNTIDLSIIKFLKFQKKQLDFYIKLFH